MICVSLIVNYVTRNKNTILKNAGLFSLPTLWEAVNFEQIRLLLPKVGLIILIQLIGLKIQY